MKCQLKSIRSFIKSNDPTDTVFDLLEELNVIGDVFKVWSDEIESISSISCLSGDVTSNSGSDDSDNDKIVSSKQIFDVSAMGTFVSSSSFYEDLITMEFEKQVRYYFYSHSHFKLLYFVLCIHSLGKRNSVVLIAHWIH